jgi:hypothetical protein
MSENFPAGPFLRKIEKPDKCFGACIVKLISSCCAAEITPDHILSRIVAVRYLFNYFLQTCPPCNTIATR